jgi:hypothetical protein
VPTRYLLCRPRGGLNDTLCRIALCLTYAQRFQRTLVIDCQQSSLFGHFSDYFRFREPTDAVIPSLDAELSQQLAALPCRPAVLQGKVRFYLSRTTPGMGHVHVDSGVPTRFSSTYPMPFVDDFPEDLLIYDDSGGGTASFGLLPQLVLAPSVLAEAEETLQRLPRHYCAVHVRNTDYRSNYRLLFHRIRKRVAGRPVLVCSDDPAVMAYAEEVFPDGVLRTPRRVRSADALNTLHGGVLTEPGARPRAATEALVDLVCLANADVLYAGHLMSRASENSLSPVFHPVRHLSGFSLLAQHLCRHKPVLDAMLDRPARRRRPTDAAAGVVVDMRPVFRRLLSGGRAVWRTMARPWR